MDNFTQIRLVSALSIQHHKILRYFFRFLQSATATSTAFDLIKTSLTQIRNEAHTIAVVKLIVDAEIVLFIPPGHVC